MKTLLLFSFLAPTLLFGQITNHFSHQDSKWNVAKTSTAATQEHPNFVATTTTVYGFQGDSTISGEVWSKMYSTNDSTFQSNLVFEGLTKVENDFVLFKSATDPIDTLYNFNLSVGDSVFYEFDFFTSWIHVDEIQSVQINGESYKKFIFSEPTGPTAFDHLNEVWIEGIGSVHGPLFPLSPVKFSEEMPDSMLMTCSFANSLEHYNHPGYSDCFTEITLGIMEENALNFNLYPNPVSSLLTIEPQQKSKGVITIFDVYGASIKTIESHGETVKIDVSHWESGIYFLRMDNSSQRQVKKIIVQ
ncbi:T9SS type A sorting domain-containing protein [Brumimicrobium sp.]|uniref:T9SS type A sorting domain-containing protein n=1 Tax=Brumimicrobium sp. TaxID=2029867 RepID=UPI003A941CB1